MRKLVPILTVISCINTATSTQNFQQQFPFPPRYQSQSVSEGSIYLPPETQTTLPLYPKKNTNNLHYPYLPATGTKAPSVYPSPFPMMMSSTFVPNFDDEDDTDDDGEDNDGKLRTSSPHPSMFNTRPNRTQYNASPQNSMENRKEIRSLSNNAAYNQPIDRIDIKFPHKFGPNQPSQYIMQTPASRRMIISQETVKSEPLIGDQLKTQSYNGVHYIPPPPGFISSTTEPAIPILRLSNEMDLDGSYSYEALGADQTHYVQHSRMENMGTDKEEQVVEGSYSYVGDNGQTYTVHYVADANGFRASGDHLPVAPPVPEIIQRSIQYNLAEEAKRPHQLQEWQHDNNRNNEIDGRDRSYRFALTSPPTRNLFTGRAPEAFSYNFAQSSNTQSNNIVPAPSSPAPVITHLDQAKEQPPKQPSGPIVPQVTFLASQGAHVPSMNPSPPQQSISRVYNTNNEKSHMPSLMSYELTTLESDHENSKPLWRWQYGMNGNTAKNTISRSSTHSEDEVAINFSDMTPDQYRFMIHSKFDPEGNENDIATTASPIVDYRNRNENLKNVQNLTTNDRSVPLFLVQGNNNLKEDTHTQQNNFNHVKTFDEQSHTPTPRYMSNWHSEPSDAVQNPLLQQPLGNMNFNGDSRDFNQGSSSKLITQNDFIPPSQTVTESYDYDESYYEPRKLKSHKINSVTIMHDDYKNGASENNIERPAAVSNEHENYSWHNQKSDEEDKAAIVNTFTSIQSVKTTTTPVLEEINKYDAFRPSEPIFEISNNNKTYDLSTTTDNSIEDMFKNNIFLKNLLSAPNVENFRVNKENVAEEPFKPINRIQLSDRKEEKIPKSLQPTYKTNNDLKFIKNKPMDISDVIHYVSMKNHFESSKLRPKFQKKMNYPNKPDAQFTFPLSKLGEDNGDNKNELKEKELTIQERPISIIKKYKILQRNNNYNVNQNNVEGNLNRNLMPPALDYKLVSSQNLPPLGRAGPTLKSYLPPLFV